MLGLIKQLLRIQKKTIAGFRRLRGLTFQDWHGALNARPSDSSTGPVAAGEARLLSGAGGGVASSDSAGVESDEEWFRRTVGEGWPGHELRPLLDFSLGDACADVGATTEDVGMGVESRDVSSDLDCDGCDSLWRVLGLNH